MIVALVTLLFVSAVVAENRPMISGVDALDKRMVDFINSIDTTWKAGSNFEDGYTSEQLKNLMGVLPPLPGMELPIKTSNHEDLVDLIGAVPDTFDARTQWPNCPSIKEVRDQGSCGSCWAFGAVEAISDRLCIATNGQFKEDISAEDLVSCCGLLHLPPCGMGCNGGWPNMAWKHWQMNGIVTGGLYNGTGCRPYTIPPCAHHQKGTPLPDCTDILPTPACKTTCQQGYKKEYEQDKTKGKEVYQVKEVAAIQAEIMKNGPVEAQFTVFADFPSYKSGVYQQHSQEQLGGHAVKIIGWGTEGGVPYWLVVNSWNVYWGDKGLFKIRRGTNECGIEDGINGGIPAL